MNPTPRAARRTAWRGAITNSCWKGRQSTAVGPLVHDGSRLADAAAWRSRDIDVVRAYRDGEIAASADLPD